MLDINITRLSNDWKESPAPSPPWQLHGSAVLSVGNWRSGLGLIHYTASPVGPYDELAVVRLTWQGPSITSMWVTSPASQRGGRENWGYPKELGQLQWRQDGERITFWAEARCWRWRTWGPTFPVRAAGWTAQTLHDATVRVPVRLEGRARLAWRGRQVGLSLSAFIMTVSGPENYELDAPAIKIAAGEPAAECPPARTRNSNVLVSPQGDTRL